MNYHIAQTGSFGFLPQFEDFGGTASYPTAVAKALAQIVLDLAPAAFSDRLGSYDDWVSVRDDLATQYFFTSASNDPPGTLPALGLIGLDQYLRQQQLDTHIALSSIGLSVSPDKKIQAGWNEPISLSHPAIGSASQYDHLFTEQSVTGGFLRASLLRGEPIIAGLYQPIEMSSAVQGVHTLVLTALDWNDHNANGRIDESESPTLTFQDPLQPALPANSIATIPYPDVESQLIGPHFSNGTLMLDEAGLLSLSYIQYKLYEEWPTPAALTLGDPRKIHMTSAMYEELSILNATVLHPASLPHHVDKLILDSDVAGLIRFDDQAFENKRINGKLYTHEESHHDNILRFYQIADIDGTIIDPQSNAILLPSDDGYQQLALELASTRTCAGSMKV